MRIECRRLGLGEFNHELLWLLVSAVSLGIATLWLTIGLPWPHCVFHDLTGLPCLTCGATRSAFAFFHGHFLKAIRWNPLVFLIFCGLSIFNVYAFTILIFRGPRLRLAASTEAEKRIFRTGVITLLACNWVYLLVHASNY